MKTLMDAIDNVLGCATLFAVVLFFHFQVLSYNRKYRLSKQDQHTLFFFLFHGSDGRKLMARRPDMMRKEFPEYVAAIETPVWKMGKV